MVQSIDRLKALSTEIQDMVIVNPIDYSVEGLSSLAEEILRTRAFALRASAIQGEALLIHSKCKVSLAALTHAYQDDYDSAVQAMSARLSSLSWEERASMYRVKCLGTLAPKREADRLFLLIEGFVSQIEALSRAVYQSPRPLDTLANLARTEGFLNRE